MSKLKNTEAIRQMLSGEHKTQTKIQIGYDSANTKIQRLIGDTWSDDDGNQWEQKDGFVIKHGKLDSIRKELNTFENCFEKEKGNNCKKTQYNISQADEKLRKQTGRCLECQISYEHKLQLIPGAFEKYENEKIYNNVVSWFKEAERDKELIKQSFKQTNIPNPDGDIEVWKDTISYEERCKQIDEEFEKFKTEYLDKLKEKLK